MSWRKLKRFFTGSGTTSSPKSNNSKQTNSNGAAAAGVDVDDMEIDKAIAKTKNRPILFTNRNRTPKIKDNNEDLTKKFEHEHPKEKVDTLPLPFRQPFENRVFKVERLKPFVEKDEFDKLLKKIHDGKAKESDMKRLKNANKSSFKGNYFSVFFRCDKPIQLVALEFYGPNKFPETKDFLEYNVRIEIYVPIEKAEIVPTPNSLRILKQITPVRVPKPSPAQEIEPKDYTFAIEIQPVLIVPQEWYLIYFELDGPDTKIASTHYSAATKFAETPEQITFEFLQGSNQLPILRYTLISPDDIK